MEIKHNFKIVCCDTDSIAFNKQNGSPFSSEEQEFLINEINSLLDDRLIYEDDGYYEKIVVVKAKNYITQCARTGKVSYKGSSIKDQKKEPALREMMDTIINDLLETEGANVVEIYEQYIVEAMNIKDISRWATKKSVSKAVLNPARKNEQKILDAIEHKEPREGDKFWLYSAIDGEIQKVEKGEPVFLKSGEPKMIENKILRCVDEWQGDEDKLHYVKRVYNTIKILETVLDMEQFIKYHNVGNRKLLDMLQTDLGRTLLTDKE